MAKSTVRALVLIAAAFVSSCAFAAHGTYDRQVSAPAGGHLRFRTDVGSVTVVGTSGSTVIVHADLEGPKSYLSRFRITTERTPSGVTVSAREPASGWLDWFGFGWHRVRFTVQVPSDYPVDVQTSGGDLTVRDVSASVRGATSGGGVEAENITGTVDLHTSGGSVDAQHLTGPAHLSTSGGNVHVVDSTGNLDLRTSGGDIRMRNDDGQVRAVTSGGDIHAQLRSNQGITLKTDGGDITLLLPQDMHASIEARSSGGGITCEFPLGTARIQSGHFLQGTVGGGGPPITLRTSGGDIHIEPIR
jgi:hypothetical protein